MTENRPGNNTPAQPRLAVPATLADALDPRWLEAALVVLSLIHI